MIEPTTDLVWSFHMEAIAVHLQAVTEGRIRKLLVNVPPRSSKSTLVSVLWPAWEWVRDPSQRWLFASYSLDLSTRHSLQRRRLVESDWFKGLWGDTVKLSSDQANKREFENTATGYMIATSVGGTVTGRGGNRLVLDDPHNVGEAESEVVREGVLEWFQRAWATRRNNAATSAEVCIMQRVHQADVAGSILKSPGWDHLIIPMEYEGPKPATSIGWVDPRTRVGELLCPERWSPDEVADLKVRLGSYGYAGQFQQRPVPAEGGVVKRSWLKYYDWTDKGIMDQEGLPINPADHARFITVDVAASLREEADFTAIGVWSLYFGRRPHLALLDVVHDRVEGPDILPAIKRLRAKWKAGSVWIEKVAFQLALVQLARREGIPVREYEPKGDKMGRLISATPLMEAGGFWLPRQSPWLDRLESELLSFPKGEHDDLVDMISSAAIIAQRFVGQILPSEVGDAPKPHRDAFGELFPGSNGGIIVPAPPPKAGGFFS